MIKRGSIICHTRPLPFGGRHISYSWEGGDVIEMSADCGVVPALPGNLFRIGPFWLRALEYRYWSMTVLACRERPVKAMLYSAFYRATRALDRVYRLLIITLYVWGLARYDRARVPTWRDVKGMGKLIAWVDRRADKKRRVMIERINQRLKEETQE